MSNFQQTEKTQYFDWGTILWFFEPDNLDIERLSIGLVTFNLRAVHEMHLHSGDEQVIYIVSGNGYQIVNGETDVFKPGDIKHIPPYASHKVVNTGPNELKLIIVYTPSKFQPLLTPTDKQIQLRDLDLGALLDDVILRQLLNKLSQALDLSLIITDVQGREIITTDNYPDFCRMMASASDKKHCRVCLARVHEELGQIQKPYLHICCNDIVSIIMPIYTGDTIIGYIKCGQVFLSKPQNNNIMLLREFAAKYNLSYTSLFNAYLKIKIEPKSRLYTASEAMCAIANYITDTAVEMQQKKELHNSKISLIEEQMAKSELKRALYESNLQLLQSQINPHFLFNTLNTIAQLAYLDGAERVAGLVWNLSELLRVALGKTKQRVSLREELKMLDNYLSIQLARYGGRLEIQKEIDSHLGDLLETCKMLQTLEENSIIHGLVPKPEKGVLIIVVHLVGQKVAIEICDNGIGFDTVQEQKNKHNKIGINSVKAMLKHCYGGGYHFTIHSKPGYGTKVTMLLPILKGE